MQRHERMLRTGLWRQGWLTMVLVLGALVGCRNGTCEGGTCSCPEGSSCEFECLEPPCHVECAGDNSSCSGECANGECSCGAGSHCDLGCLSPPCHVECEGASCVGACANGDCYCGEGGSCEFRCESGPCHVLCAGENEHCSGQCTNGSCSCGPDSTCAFECLDGNCTFQCEEGASCVATCPGGSPGEQGCTFSECAASAITICDDGQTLTCGAPCPPPPDEEAE